MAEPHHPHLLQVAESWREDFLDYVSMTERQDDGIVQRQSAAQPVAVPPLLQPVTSVSANEAMTQHAILPQLPSVGVPNPRSCATCRRRKVRCDRQQPCSNCQRAQIACVPAPLRAPRKRRAKPTGTRSDQAGQQDAEVIERLRRLEAIVRELSTQVEVDSGVKAQPVGAATTHHHSQQGQAPGDPIIPRTGSQVWTESQGLTVRYNQNEGQEADSTMRHHFGRMVLDNQSGTRRYISSTFWSKLNDQIDTLLQETRVATDYDTDESEFEETTADDSPSSGTGFDHHYAFVLGCSVANVDVEKLRPLPPHAHALWSIYLQNVERLVKVLHVPTADVILHDARRGSMILSPGNTALVFSIYFAAITSLEPDEVRAKFGTGKADLLKQYRFAMEHSLAKAKFLDTSDVTVVQALTIFLTVARKHDESRFYWAMTGLLIRIAQGLGLHRDGTLFHLSPFDTEMRRRLWWAILLLDFRSAEALGTDLTVGEHSYNTRIPSNINDADISVESIDLPAPREGKSDTAVAILRAEICTLSRRLAAVDQANKESTSEKERMLVETYQHIDRTFLQYVRDDTDSLYWVAAMIARIITAKNRLMINQAMLFPGSGRQPSAEWRLQHYTAAIEALEYSHELNLNDRYKPFRWLFKAYNNWFIVAYILIETCRRPWTILAERGWKAVNGYEKNPVEIAKKADHAAVFLPLRHLFSRARKHREQEKLRLMAKHGAPQQGSSVDCMYPTQPWVGSSAEGEFDFAGGVNLVDLASTGSLSCSSQQDVPKTTLAAAESSDLQGTATGRIFQHPQTAAHGEAMPFGVDWSEVGLQSMAGFWPSPGSGAVQAWNIAADNAARNVPATVRSMLELSDEMTEVEGAAGQQHTTPSTRSLKYGQAPPNSWANPSAIDSDMLGNNITVMWDDFNWQDWSQKLRGFEAEMVSAPEDQR